MKLPIYGCSSSFHFMNVRPSISFGLVANIMDLNRVRMNKTATSLSDHELKSPISKCVQKRVKKRVNAEADSG